MVAAMFLAHLVGDYILQWDSLALWKARHLHGVVAHGLIVALVTGLLAVAIEPGWWPWALFIAGTHLVVDAAQLPLNRRLARAQTGLLGFVRFALDQALHVSVILLALIASGYLSPGNLAGDLFLSLTGNRWLAYLLGYAFISMPTWILVRFLVHGLLNRSTPDFSPTAQKYAGITERWLITTFVLLGQFFLVPLAATPRLLLARTGRRPPRTGRRAMLYFLELAASLVVAISVGMALRALT